MTTGYINQYREAVIPIDIFDRQGRLRRIAAIIDTGFDYYLTLPPHMAQALGLAWANTVKMLVATDRVENFDSCAAVVWWFDRRREIRVLQSQNEILVGTRLLWGSSLTIQSWDGGMVTVASPSH